MTKNRRAEYHTKSTSRTSADVLGELPLRTGSDWRRYAKAQIVEHPTVVGATVDLAIRVQRRHGQNSEWLDADSFDLRTLRAGEEVMLEMNAEETLALFNRLSELYEISGSGVPMGRHRFILFDVDEGSGRSTSALSDTQFASLLDELVKSGKRIPLGLALEEVHTRRKEAVAQFESHLDTDDWKEPDWQCFFDANRWIFGFGFDWRFHHTVETRPNLGASSISGGGAPQSDFALATAGARSFMVLVELKRPSHELVGPLYRARTYEIGKELINGVAQVQTQLHVWQSEGAEARSNASLETAGLLTADPKGILLIGNLAKLAKHELMTFERFRRALRRPDIVTYDELLERARHLVEHPPELATTQP